MQLNGYTTFTAADSSYRFQYPAARWKAPVIGPDDSVSMNSSDPAAPATLSVMRHTTCPYSLIGFQDRWYQQILQVDPRSVADCGYEGYGMALSGINALQETFVLPGTGPSGRQMLRHRIVMSVPPNNRNDAFVLWMFTTVDQEPATAADDFDDIVASFQMLIPGTGIPDTRPAQLTSRKAGISLTFPGNWEKCNRTGWDASLRIYGIHGEQNGENMSITHVPGPVSTLSALAGLVTGTIHRFPHMAVLSQKATSLGGEQGLLRILSYAYYNDGIARYTLEAMALHAGNGLLVAYEAPAATFETYAGQAMNILGTIRFIR